MFNVPEECWTTYVKSKATWGTAKRNTRVQAAGEGKIVIHITADNNKKYAIEVFGYHVPQLAMNLLSVFYLCKRGYIVEHHHPAEKGDGLRISVFITW